MSDLSDSALEHLEAASYALDSITIDSLLEDDRKVFAGSVAGVAAVLNALTVAVEELFNESYPFESDAKLIDEARQIKLVRPVEV